MKLISARAQRSMTSRLQPGGCEWCYNHAREYIRIGSRKRQGTHLRDPLCNLPETSGCVTRVAPLNLSEINCIGVSQTNRYHNESLNTSRTTSGCDLAI
jgi:hypothetical protein